MTKVRNQIGLSSLQAKIGILFLACITGTNYLIMKLIITDLTPISVIFWRLLFAVLCILPFIRNFDELKEPALWRKGGLVGFFLGLALVLLAFGLKAGGSGETAFWVSSDAAFVSIINFIVFRELPHIAGFVGTCCAIIGLGLLSITSGFELREGSIFGIFSAISFAIWIIGLYRISRNFNSINLGFVQMLIALIFTAITMHVSQTFSYPNTNNVWLGCLFLGVIGTGFRFVIQSYLQRYVDPADTSVIYLVEPVIAAILGYYFLSEYLTVMQIAGCILILIGIIVSQKLFSRFLTSH
jgi:drug/metabolite transporter (DMT)-like permease